MTTQEAYEGIREYFTQPDAKLGVIPGTAQCRYRTPEGGRCAVGSLIPDELYNPAFEGQGAKHVIQGDRLLCELFYGVNLEFIRAAQRAHDEAALHPTELSVQNFVDQLDGIASDYNLKVAKGEYAG